MQVLSIYAGIFYLFFENYEHMTFRVIRFTITVCTQQIRYSFLFIVIDRIAATVFYKNYARQSSGFYRLVATVFLTYGFSIMNAYLEYMSKAKNT